MNKQKLFLIAFIVAGLVGCTDFLVESPQQSLDLDQVLNNAEGLRGLVTGMYNATQDADISGGNYNVIPEIMADNVVWTGSFTTYLDFHQHRMNPDNGNTVAWWTDSYVAINLANIVLETVDQISDPTISDAQKNIWRGDASFVRGMAYFELARVYAKPWVPNGANTHLAVPVRTKPVKSSADFENLPRNTMAEVFARADADFKQAATLLPNERVRADRRATSYSALGYLMRMEMVKQNYSAAADYAQQIVAGGFTLTAAPNGPFVTKFSTESVYEVAHLATDNPGVNAGQNAFYAPTANGGRGDIKISAAFVTAIGQIITPAQQAAVGAAGGTATDLRRTTLLNGLVANTSGSLKFVNATRDNNVLNLRYADVLLTRAEALAEQAASLAAVPAEVYTLVNTVRKRAITVTGGTATNALIEYGPASFASKQELIDAILLERRVELAFEGDRFYTLHRRGLSIQGDAPNSNSITFPIPQQEIDANPNMVQNPGY
ncbi:MAG: RagB/SusD family nutrient uptake outer membrane protein [Bacteroidota bacterium]